MSKLLLTFRSICHRYRHYAFLLILTLFMPFAWAASDSPLSLAESMRLATDNQPVLQALDIASAASREAAIAEAQLPDPKLKVGMINLPVTSRDAFNINRDDQTMANIAYAQEVIPNKKREIAADLKLAEAGQFETEHEVSARTIKREVALVWLDTFEAQRKTELYQRLINDMLAQRKVLATSLSSGAVAASEIIQLDSETSLIKEKLIFAQRDERKARAALSRWIGDSASRPMATELPMMRHPAFSNDSVAEIEQHPVLKNARQTEKAAALELEAAKAGHERNWEWEVGYGKRFNDRSDMLSFQVSVDLQTDQPNRQDKRGAEKLLLLEKSQQLTEDRRRELQMALKNAEADADAASAREQEHLNSLIPNAQARLSLAQAAYSAGKKSLDEVWQARRSLVEVEIDHWAILADQQRAAVNIAYLLNDNSLLQGN